VARFPEFSLPEHQSSDSENESVIENMVYVTTNDDRKPSAEQPYERAVLPTQATPTNITATLTNPTERVATTNEATILLEILATTNDTNTENITPTAGTGDVVTPEEIITTTNDATNSMILDRTDLETSGMQITRTLTF
jgi:hypothetical protein